MKHRIVLAFLLTALMLSCGRQKPKNEPEQSFQLQVMSYNVRHCAGMDLMVEFLLQNPQHHFWCKAHFYNGTQTLSHIFCRGT